MSLDCKIKMTCIVNLSENPQKLKQAITNVFLDCLIKHESNLITATSNDINSLKRIHQYIHSQHSQKTYKRTLVRYMDNNSTWFYLNKQAAFAKKIAICEDIDESPLGPIKVILTSNNIKKVIEWLTNS